MVVMMMTGWRMVRVIDAVVDERVETVVLVRGVRHFPEPAVRLDQTVSTVHRVPVPFLPMILFVLGVRVLDAVLERVLGRRLWTRNRAFILLTRTPDNIKTTRGKRSGMLGSE